MFTFNESQLQQMSSERLRAFTKEMVAHLKDKFQEFSSGKSDEDLHRIVDAAMASARGAGFTGKGHLRRYISLTGALGEDFAARYDWAAQTLANDEKPLHEKISELEETAVFVVKGA